MACTSCLASASLFSFLFTRIVSAAIGESSAAGSSTCSTCAAGMDPSAVVYTTRDSPVVHRVVLSYL